MVLDRHAQDVAGREAREPRRAGVLDDEVDVAADEAPVVVGAQDARQEPGLAQHLEAVADAEHRARPAAAKASTSRIIGAKRAIAPARR